MLSNYSILLSCFTLLHLMPQKSPQTHAELAVNQFLSIHILKSLNPKKKKNEASTIQAEDVYVGY